MIGVFADKVDSATVNASACAIVNQALSAIPKTTDSDDLKTYAEMMGLLAGEVDTAAAQAIVNQVLSAILRDKEPGRDQGAVPCRP